MSFIKSSGRSDISHRATKAAEIVTSTPATALLRQTSLLPNPPPNTILFDNACGAGTITASFLSLVPESDQNENITSILCGDLDLTMLDILNERIKSSHWTTKVHAGKLDSHATALPSNHFTHVLMNFGPQLMKDAKQMLVESHRILQPAGILGFTTWLMPGFVPSMKVVFPQFDPSALPLAPEWRDAEKMKGLLMDLGFRDSRVEQCAFETEHEDVDGYLELFTEVLMKPFFDMADADAKARYSEYIRQPGNLKLRWTALVVTAVKS